ncbi:MAG TPA: regulatory protein RecX [Gammaproteobacteria bacterium]|nr:regulatory protein RecX [Gammaproteobacteria bacterium]
MERTALGLLARREHARRELRTKLLARGHAETDVERVLDELEGRRLLSEDRFVEQFIASRVARGTGPVKIRAELVARGVAEAVIAAALAAAETDWRALAERVRQKRFGPVLPATSAERARQARFLAARGFTQEQVRGALRGDLDEG